MKHDKISTKIAKAGTPLKHHDAEQKNRYSSGLEDNLKKALTELLILFLFGEEEHYIGELSPLLEKRSHGVLSIVFPYANHPIRLPDGDQKENRPGWTAAAVLCHYGDRPRLPPEIVRNLSSIFPRG